MAGYAVFFGAFDAECPAPHVQTELPAGRTEEGELVEQIDMGITVAVRHEVPFRSYLVDRRTHHNKGAVEAPAVKGDELVVALYRVPELYEDLFFGRGLVTDAVLFKRQKGFAGILKIEGAFAAVGIEHADGDNLSRKRVERKALFYFLPSLLRNPPSAANNPGQVFQGSRNLFRPSLYRI